MYSASLGPNDHWLTQPKTWKEFAQFLQKDEVIWEPFVCQPHNISKETWEELGYECIQTTSDFFETTQPPSTTCLISNPPFSRKFDVLEKCFDSNMRFSLLVPSWVMACSTFRKLVKKYNVQDLAIVIPSKRTHYINPTTMKVLNKTNFDSLFMSRGMISAGIYYLWRKSSVDSWQNSRKMNRENKTLHAGWKEN